MSNIEEKILESLGWEEDSPVFALLQDKTSQQQLVNQFINNVNSNNHGAPGISSVRQTPLQALASPVRKPTRNAAQPNPLISPDPKGQQRRAGSHSLELFYRKVAHLTTLRVKDLCHKLQLATKIYQQVSRKHLLLFYWILIISL
jgi:hypothetical protein